MCDQNPQLALQTFKGVEEEGGGRFPERNERKRQGGAAETTEMDARGTCTNKL